MAKKPSSARKGDDKLSTYRQKRDFAKTPEPSGGVGGSGNGRNFLVQKHAARRLHYDFRLEMGGVLMSWAVTRGPSLDPADRRLAVHVEDHPLDYGSFEGVIPQGQYGGGTVMLWDRGTWEPEGNPNESYAKGRLKFRLHGERLTGGWHLVRMQGKSRKERRDNWLLIKSRDEAAEPGNGERLLRQATTSVVSGRSMEQIAEDRDRVWSSKGEANAGASAEKPRRKRQSGKPATATMPIAAKIEGARRATLPDFVAPQLASLVGKAPSGDKWLHEIKLDGYRTLCRIDGGNVRMLSRRGQDWTHRFRRLAEAATAFPVKRALIDGEVVVLTDGGASDFRSLQEALSANRQGVLSYYVFDLLHLDGYDLTAAPLHARKAALRQLVVALGEGRRDILYSDHLEGEGGSFFQQACRLALEGVVSKRRDGSYRSDRNGDWRKVKCIARQEFVIGGFTRSTVKTRGIRSLLLGYYQNGALQYAGRVGTGFTTAEGQELRRKLNALRRDKPAFEKLPHEARKGAIWVAPEVVCEVEFSEWTGSGMLRHPSFQGVREDKQAETVVMEQSENDGAKRYSVEQGQDQSEVAGVRLTHPDRVLYPEQGLTKRGLAEYYETIADWVLPHVVERPLSLVRCPSGQDKQCFFQRHAGAGVPDTIHEVPVQEKRQRRNYLMIRDLAGLISLVQIGVLELHPWGSRADDVDRPDRVIFDLDPDPSVSFERVVAAAQELHDRLDRLGLESFLKTTGGKGLHVVVPLARRHGWDEAKAFAGALARAMTKDSPRAYIATATKAARKGRIFIDYLRNDRGATAIAPYSTRARPGAPVATPLAWGELGPSLRSDRYTVETLPRRLARLSDDPWAGMQKTRQSITAKMRRELGLKD